MVLPLTSGTFHFFLWIPSLWSQFELSLHRRFSWLPKTFTFLLSDCTFSETLKIHSYASCCPRVRIWLLKFPNSPVSPASAPGFLDHGWPSSLALPLCLANLGVLTEQFLPMECSFLLSFQTSSSLLLSCWQRGQSSLWLTWPPVSLESVTLCLFTWWDYKFLHLVSQSWRKTKTRCAHMHICTFWIVSLPRLACRSVFDSAVVQSSCIL